MTYTDDEYGKTGYVAFQRFFGFDENPSMLKWEQQTIEMREAWTEAALAVVGKVAERIRIDASVYKAEIREQARHRLRERKRT